MTFYGNRAYAPGKVTAVIPAHGPRVTDGLLSEALRSVLAQSRPVDAVSVAIDQEHAGAAATRNTALAAVNTEWTAFLDSDDLWYPDHIDRLMRTAATSGADVVYPWFDVLGGNDPFPQYEGKPFDPDVIEHHQNFIPITVLARTSMLHVVGGFEHRGDPTNPCEDWGMWIKCLGVGARFVHAPVRTWAWRWHNGNTSGRGDRW